MKQIRRVTVEIERSTVTWTGRRGVETPKAIPMHAVTQHGAPPEEPVIPCSRCGSTWSLLHDADRTDQAGLQTLLETLGLHTHLSASGYLWVCRGSFRNLELEKRRKK